MRIYFCASRGTPAIRRYGSRRQAAYGNRQRLSPGPLAAPDPFVRAHPPRSGGAPPRRIRPRAQPPWIVSIQSAKAA
jgi:hypothetical protein